MKILVISFFDDNFGDMLIRVCFDRLTRCALKNLGEDGRHAILHVHIKDVTENDVADSSVVFFAGGAMFGMNNLSTYENIELVTKAAEEHSVPVIFSSIGINNFHAAEDSADRLNGNLGDDTLYGNKGDDGAYLTDDKTVGLDPVRSACIPRAITNGMVVAAISPFTPAGRAIYRDCGMQLLATHETAAEYRAAENEVKAEVAAQGGALLAFGLGAEASIIGDIRGGLDVEPICTYPNKKFYNRYILLFRVRTTTNAGLLEFAGVIDPCGNTVRAAREAIATP